MDINAIGIGALIGAVITSTLNLFISWRNKERDEIKERLEKLYLPMKKVLNKPKAMDNNYETFLEIEKIYAEYGHLVSPRLEHVLYDVVSAYHSLLRDDLTAVEIKEKITAGSFKSYKKTLRKFDALIHDIDAVVDAGMSELLRQYRGGFKVYLVNFIQFFHSLPHSPKEWRREYAGYRDDD